MKKCSKCKEEKPDAAFGRDERATTGLRCACRDCDSKTSGAWNRRNLRKVAAYRNKYYEVQRARSLIESARTRARKRGLDFDLDEYRSLIQARIDAGCCELSGTPFNLSGGRTFDSPSIDRVFAGGDYVYSNIRIVCSAMNAALGDWGEENLYAVVTAWLAKREGESVAGKDARSFDAQNKSTGINAL